MINKRESKAEANKAVRAQPVGDAVAAELDPAAVTA